MKQFGQYFKHQLTRRLTLSGLISCALLVLVTPVGYAVNDSFEVQVAKRCAGEAGWNEGSHLCACTVRSRLDHGWKRQSVLSSYYAPDSNYTPEMFEAVLSGLTDALSCPADAYYLFEPKTISKLHLTKVCQTAFSKSPINGNVVTTYRYDTLKNKKCFN